jgi:DNA-binding transcriptional ArsR family regulator
MRLNEDMRLKMPAGAYPAPDGFADAGNPSSAELSELVSGIARLHANAEMACDLLKSMAHEGRLVILCLLSLKERSVMELEESLDLRQPAVSQQLARLRADNLVKTRRDGKMIYYSLASEEARAVVSVLTRFFGKA